ncbi:LysR family transcriptional regulator [Sphingomonas histidinilytica]|uniref:DNA-binding transcriptional regulator, LysR family n=1 Tax=Rhizorhabdus histidinilytica TaxID=439228 RepID=A0A1T5CWU7_9SPHN|nr:LysR substrate-binding domain-containing protein [Rhizorhabdus histidinilytica]MBO9376279.1 LysR family transcriptional regulator [Rhizorhabdus histidinilytica]SKB63817.1 DNA-binding transcriptional regulator, LysR family [Rhizorhabdus histidinilytica]
MHLRGLDLNLLIALDALFTEKNVTRAAERINISQPGMSAALQKLRWHFSDPLLERVGRRMELTVRGRALADPVREILIKVRDLTDKPEEFDPATARRVFRIGATTFCSDILAAPLLCRIERISPNISVQFEDLATDTVHRLIDGQLDFAITISARILSDEVNLDSSLSSLDLFTDEFVLVTSRQNSRVGDTVTFDQLCELPYIETRFGNVIAGISEQMWRQQPKQPQIRAWLPNFQLTLDTVSHTDMVAIVPLHLAQLHGDRYNVRTLPVPVEMPTIEERLFWHQRNDQDPGHAWFKGLLQETVQGFLS